MHPSEHSHGALKVPENHIIIQSPGLGQWVLGELPQDKQESFRRGSRFGAGHQAGGVSWEGSVPSPYFCPGHIALGSAGSFLDTPGGQLCTRGNGYGKV